MFSEALFANAAEENGTIENEVLDRLIGYVTQVDGEKKVAATKEFTVFQDFLDVHPTFRSYLLQLVLRYGGRAAMTLLEKYLERADQLLRYGEQAAAPANARAMVVRIELHTMVVRCIEQTFWMRRGVEHNSLRFASTLLQEIHESLQMAGERAALAARLEIISKIRFAFEVVVDHLSHIIAERRLIGSH